MTVTDYYDNNTRRFIRFGVGKGEYAIHRQAWGTGVSTEAEALHFAEDLIIRRMAGSGIKSVLDMGCGVGGTIRYMRDRYPAHYRGITISPVQARMAEQILGNDAVMMGDMTDGDSLPSLFSACPHPAAIVCIEAFLHLKAGARWFHELARHTAPGDLLFIQDNFLSNSGQRGRRDSRFIDDFTTGWKASSLLTTEEVIDAAEAAGFAILGDVNLTPMLKSRPMQRLSIALLVALLKPLRIRAGWWDNFSGGNALQRCIRRGLTSYRQLVFVRERWGARKRLKENRT